MEHFQIKGRVVFQNLGTGFWGIVDADERKWRPLTMPHELQKEGLEVEVTVEKAAESVSLFMWGTAVKIVGH